MSRWSPHLPPLFLTGGIISDNQDGSFARDSRGGSLLGLIHRGEDEGMVVTAYAAVAGDLADVVDCIRVDQSLSRVLWDQRVQVLHSFGGCPD